MIIERKHGAYTHRKDPVLIAVVAEIKRQNEGEFYAAPIKRKAKPAK